LPKHEGERMSRVLIIPDTHSPFMHPNFIKFLRNTRDEYKPDRIVHIGDLVDLHSLSNYMQDPDGFSCGEEWRRTVDDLQKIYKEFPIVQWIVGNHDRRPYRKAYDIGMSNKMIKPLSEIYETPVGWSIESEIIIDDVLYTHGEGAGGNTGWQNFSVKQNMSSVFGHFHAVGGVRYHQNRLGQQLFSMCVGCGVDETAYAMAYGKHMTARPMLGCGTVTDGVYANFIPMDLGNRNYRRIR
jgi:predicted phosphodiesterase